MKRRTKGSGSIRQRSNGIWDGRYTEVIGEQKSIYGKTNIEVKEELSRLSYINSITHYDNVAGDVSLSVWFAHYIEIKKNLVKPQSIDQIKTAFFNHIEPVIGRKKMCNITLNDTTQVLSAISRKGLSKSSQSNVYHHMSAMFRFAFEEGIIQRNPMIATKKKVVSKTTRRSLTDEEIEVLMRYVRDRDYQFFTMLNIMLYTGVRPGEVCGIKWENISDDFKNIEITESLTNMTYDTDLKTESSERVVPVTDFISEELKLKYLATGQYVSSDTYVFLNKRKKPYYTTYLDKCFKTLREELEELIGISFESISPHYLRHTFASKGIASGVDIVVMKELMGHVKCNTLLDTYAHADADKKAASINKISRVINY